MLALELCEARREVDGSDAVGEGPVRPRRPAIRRGRLALCRGGRRDRRAVDLALAGRRREQRADRQRV
jgi:hypothetical protein